MMILESRVIDFGIVGLIQRKIMSEPIKAISVKVPIPSAFETDVVTARAGHNPRSEVKVGLSLRMFILPNVKCPTVNSAFFENKTFTRNIPINTCRWIHDELVCGGHLSFDDSKNLNVRG